MSDPEPPSTIRALLLTDIVDSTRLWETLGDAVMAPLITRHDRIARDLIPVWSGREIDKTDGLLVLFASAREAAGYAMDYHRALATLDPPLLARAGLHFGRVFLRENTADDIARGAKPLEVEGLALALTARIASIAQGGQTLLSAEARSALGDVDLRLLSHGHWRAHGVAQPMEVFEIGAADAPFTPPADAPKMYRVLRRDDLWLPMRQLAHGLPGERDEFIGRKGPLDDLAQRLQGGTRLVSVIGMGGTGKTRFAIRFGWTWLGDYPGGVWFCDLAAARDVDGIVDAVAQALDVPLGQEDPVVQLGHAIAGRGSCLLILDNFEQVARHAEATLGRWLDRAPQARFVVTSREVLGVPGEEVLALPPLPAAEASALFLRRAEAARRDLVRSAEVDRSIADLMRLLEGLPLAIELAAARTRVMSPPALLARMSERFRVLASAGGRVERHATLRATFDWSWDLLSPAERSALAQLSVFEGGFTLDAAEEVLDLSTCAGAPWSLDVVQSLVNKSLVRHDGARLALETSVQEYAAEHLATDGRFPGSGPFALQQAYAAHGRYFAGLALATAGRTELFNFVAACRRAGERHDAATAVATLENAWAVLQQIGPFRLGIELAEAVRRIPDLDASCRSRLELVAAKVLETSGRTPEAQACAEAALAAAVEAGDGRSESGASAQLGYILAEAGSFDAADACQSRALELARQLGDARLEFEALKCIALLRQLQGRMADGLASNEAALRIARTIGDQHLEGSIIGNLAVLHANLGSMELAQENFERALTLARETGDRRWEGNALSNLGLLHHLRGHSEEAIPFLTAATSLARELGHLRLEGVAGGNLGMVLGGLGRHEEARQRYEAALQTARQLQDRRTEGQFLGYLGLLHARSGRFDESGVCLQDAESLLRGAGDAFDLGLLLAMKAEAEQLGGRTEQAQATLAAAELQARDIGAGPDSEVGVALERARALIGADASTPADPA